MTRRVLFAAGVAATTWAGPGIAFAQEAEEVGPNLNWVFYMALIIGVGFVAFIAFSVIYYLLAVVARNRKFATQAAAPAPAPARAPAPAAVPAAQAPAQAAAPAAAAPAAPTEAPAAPTEAPPQPAAAPSAPAPTGAPAGGVPKIDPLQLPDGIDAVTRGRLKKLAVLQERGQAPPKELIEQLKGVLEEMSGGTVDVEAAASAPASAPQAQPTAEQAPAAVAPAAEPAPAEQAPPAAEQPAAETQQPAAEAEQATGDTHGLPRIDPMRLPDGIDAVARGRLKKLAILQERGTPPPADLVEALKPILDQMES